MTINYVKNENETVTINMNEEIFSEFFCICKDCGELILIKDAVLIDDEWYCKKCVSPCSVCGKYFHDEDLYQTADSSYLYCHDCFETETYLCVCGQRFRYDDSVHHIAGRYYCDDCYKDFEPLIQSYHTMKEYGDIVFYGDEKRSKALHMGFELEVDSEYSVDREAIAQGLKNRFSSFLCFENDGSLSDEAGFEIISQPATLSYHLSMMPKYEKAFEYLLDNDMKSHDIGSCGLHIHLDRQYFGDKEDSSTAKILYLFEKFALELKSFSRRTDSQCADWCRFRKQTYSTNSGWIKKAVMESKYYSSHQNRYYNVNLTNAETIEIRLFRGTLNPETFEATLKFTARLAQLCRDTRAVDLAKFTFDDLLGDDPTIRSYWNRINNK